MSLKTICALTVIAMSLSACSSSGTSGVSKPNSNTTAEQTEADKAAAEKATALQEAKSSKSLSVSWLKSAADSDLQSDFGQDGFSSSDSYEIKVATKPYSSGDNIDLSTLGEGFKEVDIIETAGATVAGSTYTAERNSKAYLYQQPYSIVMGTKVTGGTISGPYFNETIAEEDYSVDIIKGSATKVLPSVGTFKYNGVAFTENQQGVLSYDVDFAAKTGSGEITGISEAGTVTLSKGNITSINHTNPDNTTISGYGIEADATSTEAGDGYYRLGFFGPNAEEIAGSVTGYSGEIGFGGKR